MHASRRMQTLKTLIIWEDSPPVATEIAWITGIRHDFEEARLQIGGIRQHRSHDSTIQRRIHQTE